MNISVNKPPEKDTPIDVHIDEAGEHLARQHQEAVENIGRTSVESLVMLPDGSIVGKSVIEQERAAGHDMSPIYRGDHS